MLPCLITVRSTHWGIHRWAYLNLWLMRFMLGLDYKITLKEKLPNEAAIYASKHQSAWETIAFWVLIPNALFVMKRELYWLPVIGWWIWRAGNIGINRSKGSDAMKQLLAESKAKMEEGYNIIIFPEGTRVAPGEKGEYRAGVAVIANALKCPVVPIALNSGKFWPKNSFWKKGGVIQIVILKALPKNLKRPVLLKQLESEIETNLPN